MTGMEMMLKSIGFDPDAIKASLNEAKAALDTKVDSIDAKLDSIDKRLDALGKLLTLSMLPPPPECKPAIIVPDNTNNFPNKLRRIIDGEN